MVETPTLKDEVATAPLPKEAEAPVMNHAIATESQLSEKVAASIVMLVLQDASSERAIKSLGAEIIGAMVSVTVTTVTAVAVFPASSVAV